MTGIAERERLPCVDLRRFSRESPLSFEQMKRILWTDQDRLDRMIGALREKAHAQYARHS